MALVLCVMCAKGAQDVPKWSYRGRRSKVVLYSLNLQVTENVSCVICDFCCVMFKKGVFLSAKKGHNRGGRI